MGPPPNEGGGGGAPWTQGTPIDDDDEEDAGDIGGEPFPFLGFGRVGGAIFGGEGKAPPPTPGGNVWKFIGGGGGGNSDSNDCTPLAPRAGGPGKSCLGKVANGGGGGGT